MNYSAFEEICMLCGKVKEKHNETQYKIPKERQIQLGDNCYLSVIYLDVDKNIFCGVEVDNKGIYPIALDTFSDRIGNQIIYILKLAVVRERCCVNNLPSILREMADYLDGCKESEYQEYFDQIVTSGLFNDAIGKVVNRGNGYAEYLTEY